MNPLSLIPKGAFMVTSAALALTVCAMLWDNQSLRLDVAKRDTNIERLNGVISKANEIAAMQTTQITKQLLEAQNESLKLKAAHAAETRVLVARTDSLRSDLSAYQSSYRLTGPATAPGINAADTLADLFSQCADSYGELAAKADGHVIDVKALTAAWPRIRGKDQ